MKKCLAIALALTLAGCAQSQQAVDWLASDKAQKAAVNLKGLTVAIDCGLVVPGAALSQEIARAVDARQAAVDRAGRIYATSAELCAALGGPTGQ